MTRLYCPRLPWARIASKHWGLPGSHIVNRGTPVAHNQSPGPTGTAAAECPRKKSQLTWRPLQPRFPKEPHHCRAADSDDSIAANKPQASNVIRLEIVWVLKI